MWCSKCQVDVAAEVSADGRTVRCASCSSDLIAGKAAGTERNRDARDLLERWSAGDLLDPFGPLLPGDAADAPTEERPAKKSVRSSAEKGPRRPHFPIPAGPVSAAGGRKTEEQPTERRRKPGRQLRIDQRSSGPAAPHFDYSHIEPPPSAEPRRSNAMSTFGQLLAYGGVGALTVGTTLVVWGWFGGPASYTPTGWLIATAGQMLLFLGVITLISGGMEQTTDEVSRRIDSIGKRLVAFEQLTLEHVLHGGDADPDDADDVDPDDDA